MLFTGSCQKIIYRPITYEVFYTVNHTFIEYISPSMIDFPILFPIIKYKKLKMEVNMNKYLSDKEWLGQITFPLNKEMGKQMPTKPPVTPMKSPIQEVKEGGLKDIAGMDELKQLVQESFINVLRNKECAKAFGIKPPSLLFYGPAGVGKTFFAEKVAEEIGIHFMKVAPDDLASSYIHGTQAKIGELFQEAEEKAPTLLFFDEFDCMVPQRSNNDDNNQNGEVNEFLCMLNNAADRGIYVMAATNHPERIDKAVLRTGRIDELIYVDMPDSKARESLFKLSLGKLPIEKDINYQLLAEKTKGFNCSDIGYIIQVASRKMFNASIKDKGKPFKSITQEVLLDAISQRSPSVSSKDIREFDRIRMELSRGQKGQQPRSIGFH